MGEGHGASVEHVWVIGLPSLTVVGRMKKHKGNPQGLAASAALPAAGLFLETDIGE